MREQLRKFFYPETKPTLLFYGVAFGVVAASLSLAGNPVNTGICISCFMVNIAGALGLHSQVSSAYLRPEILAIVIGSFIVAFASGDFRPRRTSLPLLKFAGGAFMIWGSEVFIGCPIKMLLRIAGGGLTAVFGAAGLVVGVLLAVFFLKEGVLLFETESAADYKGVVAPLSSFFLIFASSSGIYAFASGFVGSSARHAPFAIALAAGLLVGVIGQRTRFCITGSIEKGILTRSFIEVSAVLGFLLGAFVLNVSTGRFVPSYLLEPGAHTDLFWAFASLGMVGFGAVFLGGCPFRQLVLSGEGDVGAFWVVLGMLAGAGLAVRLGISSSADGVTYAGKLAVLFGWIFFLVLALVGMKRFREAG